MDEVRKDLLQQVFFDAAAKNRPVSEEAVKAEYDRYSAQFKGVNEVSVRQIVLPTEDAANKTIAALKKAASSINWPKPSRLTKTASTRWRHGLGQPGGHGSTAAEALKAIPKGQISANRCNRRWAGMSSRLKIFAPHTGTVRSSEGAHRSGTAGKGCP